jgi:hypothetical protein
MIAVVILMNEHPMDEPSVMIEAIVLPSGWSRRSGFRVSFVSLLFAGESDENVAMSIGE